MDFVFLGETLLEVLTGLPVTLLIAVVAMVFSVPLGLLVAISRMNRIPVLKQTFSVYVSFIRGTPMLVQIYLLYFSLPPLCNYLLQSAGLPFRVSDENPLVYAIVIFTLSTTAYLSETFRSALSAVDKGQLEAAQSIGLTSFQAYIRIVIPQALTIALPSIGNIVLSVVKGTSLVFVIKVEEITAKGKIAAAEGLQYIEAYIDVFIVYLVLCLLIDKGFSLLEKHLKRYKMKTS